MIRTMLTLLMLAVFSVSLAGCIGGRGSKQTTNVKTTTTGQELEDLETAYKNGLLSDQEYQKKRKEILKEG